MVDNVNPDSSAAKEMHTDKADSQAIMQADMLMDFTDSLFYNFNTSEASQKAFERIAAHLGICGVTVCTTAGSRKSLNRTLYETRSMTAGNAHIEEKSLHSISGNTYIYRIYREHHAAPLNMMQRRMLEFVFKTLHTYLNRQFSLEMEQYAQTHNVMLDCYNATGMSEMLKEQKNSMDMRQYAAIFMNVLKFKNINAKVGFENGNRVMQQIAGSFRNLLDEDEYFAHIGGDNFTAFLKKETLQKKLALLNSVKCEIPHEGRTQVFNISFRMGIYNIEENAEDITSILENANIAYSLARQSSQQNIVYYTPEKRSEYEYRKMLETALHPALQSGEFQVYFQPKVDLDTYQICGAEALSRWLHNGVLIRPDSFIPIFERNGMIVEVDFFVFDYVCRSLREWMDDGLEPVMISVNFSRITLETPDFAKHLLEIAERYRVPSKYLEVEFTETCCMENEKKFMDILTELKDAGFSASLDDFGKGYSSINMLKNMNFDVLKLDRSFVTSKDADSERGKIILRSIIRMAQNLNIHVISEGVENLEQVTYLRQLRCDKAQGYFFDKPLPPEQFAERMRSRCYALDLHMSE